MRIQPVLVHPLVDGVYPVTRRLVYEVAAPVEREVLGLRQDRTHLLRVDVVVEVELVGWTAREHREGRLGPFWGCRSQGVAEPSEPAVQRANRELLERA